MEWKSKMNCKQKIVCFLIAERQKIVNLELLWEINRLLIVDCAISFSENHIGGQPAIKLSYMLMVNKRQLDPLIL